MSSRTLRRSAFLRLGPSALLASSGVALQTMHQQAFGPPRDSNKCSRSGHTSLSTTRIVSVARCSTETSLVGTPAVSKAPVRTSAATVMRQHDFRHLRPKPLASGASDYVTSRQVVSGSQSLGKRVSATHSLEVGRGVCGLSLTLRPYPA